MRALMEQVLAELRAALAEADEAADDPRIYTGAQYPGHAMDYARAEQIVEYIERRLAR